MRAQDSKATPTKRTGAKNNSNDKYTNKTEGENLYVPDDSEGVIDGSDSSLETYRHTPLC